MSDKDIHIETLHTDDENKDDENKENQNALENLEELELKDNDNDHDDGMGVNIDDIDITSIPAIEELRNRDDVTLTELLEYIDRYQSKVDVLRVKAVKIRETKRENVKKHRSSVIDLHNRMFKKLIETETEQKTELERAEDKVMELQTEIKKIKVTVPDANMSSDDVDAFKTSQLQQYIENNAGLEKEMSDLKKKFKAQQADLQVEKMKQERTNDSHRKSISTLHTNMFKKLLDAEDNFEDKIDRLNDEIQTKSRALTMEQMKNENQDKIRRDSIQTVHNNMLTKLLDAQAEHDEKEEKLQNEIKELKTQLRKEILRNAAQADKDKERYGDEDDDESVSDLETDTITNSDTHTNAKKGKQGKQFDDLWDEAEAEPEAENERLKAHIERIERELKEEKEKNVFIEKQRKDSIHNLHNNMFQKLLDAEFEYEEEIERLHKEKEDLNEKIAFYEEAFAKMNKNAENNTNDNIINPTQVVQLKEEIKEKKSIIEENKQKIFQLTQKIERLEVDVENEQKQRRGSVSFLSRQMMAKLLEAEEENEDQKEDFKRKLQKLQSELEESKENAFNLEKTRRNSVTKVSQTMFHKLLVAEQTKKQITATYEEKVKELEQKLAVEKLRNETSLSKQEIDNMEISKYKNELTEAKRSVSDIVNLNETKERQRRESFTQLQNSYWTKLLQAEDDHHVQIKKLKHEIVNLQTQITTFKKSIEWLTTTKLNLIAACNAQMNDLRTAVTVYNKNESASWFG